MNTNNRKVLWVPITQIFPNRYQRQEYRDKAKVLEIAESLKANRDNGSKGLLQIPAARVDKDGLNYELAFGHHRWYAFQHLAPEDTFWSEMPLIVEDLTDQQMFEAMATENLQRREISFIEEADTFHQYMTLFGKNSVETAARYGKTEEYVRSRLMFIQLPEPAKEKAKEGEINISSARMLVSAQKLGGEELVEKALKELDSMKTSRMHDTPQQAIEHAIMNAPDVEHIYLSAAPWFSANKNFPRKFLPKLSQEGVNHLLEVSSDSQSRLAREIWDWVSDGSELPANENYSSFRPENLDKLRIVLNPPPCDRCPFHSVVDGTHYCGIKTCWERKKDAWKQKELEDVSKKLGVPLYQKGDGPMVQLQVYDAADRKLWEEGAADLRLAPAQYMWNNFDGVGRDLKVVVVGETAEKRLKALGKAEEKARTGLVNRDLQGKINELTAQFELRFGWEVASLAFAPMLEGPSVPVLDYMLSDVMEYVFDDVQFPQGSDDMDELIVQARQAKKGERAQQLRRLMAYGMIFNDYLDVFGLNEEDSIVSIATRLQDVAKKWEVKLPKDFARQAQKYQADLDAAIAELKKPAAVTAETAKAKKGKK